MGALRIPLRAGLRRGRRPQARVARAGEMSWNRIDCDTKEKLRPPTKTSLRLTLMETLQ